MTNYKKIMLFAAVLSSLPVSVCNAVNANQYLSADMFANTLNMIGTDENAGLTSSGSFFSNPVVPDCSTANLSVGFPAERVQAGSNYCLKLSDIVSGNSSVAESFSYSSLHPVLSSVPFDGSNIRKTVKYDCGSGTDAECYSISGYPTAAMALANIIELADEDGKVPGSLAIPNGSTVRVDGYAVIHVRQFSMRAASRLISNPDRAGGVILLVDDFADIEGNPEKCVFSVNDPSKIDMADGCAFIYGAYILAGGKITADSVVGDFYRRCGDGDCRTFVTQSYRAAGEQEVSITPAMTRFSAPVIEISNSLIGGYTGNWNFSSSETSNYTVTIPTQLVTCERGEIRITSSSAAAVNVDINLDGVARFADDGSVSKSVSVSSNSPQTLEVVSAGSGKTVVSLGEPYVCVSSDCSFEFVDSALRFYKDNAGTAPDSVFYAGKEQQLYVAAVSSTTGGQCTFSRLSGDKITLKAHKPGGADSVLVKYSDQNTVVADKNGRDLILDYSDDGFYQLPVFTYNDAGEFILSASGKIEVSTDNSTDALQGASDALSGDTRFTASPYAVYIDLSSEPCLRCHSELGEKYDSGTDVSLNYIPKAWCKEITEKVVDGAWVVTADDALVVTADDALAGCPTAGSFAGTGETDPAVYAVPHGQEPGVSSQNYLHTGTLEWKTAGSRYTVNQIDNTGRFDFMIDSFIDPASGLTVHRTVRQNVDGYFAPWAFAVQFAPGETYAVANACVNNAAGRHSFTYFAQPFPLRMKVVARTANNLDATLFDVEKYENAAKYFPQFAAFSSLGEKLVDADSVSRLSDCGSEKPVWKDGKLTFSDYYLKLFPSGTKSSDYGNLPTRDYRGEAPSYNVAAAENSRLSAFTVSLGMQMGVSLPLTTKHHEMDYAGSYNDPSSIYYSAEREIVHGTDTYLKLFGPLDLRMGRIVLENARANPGKTMYLPLKMQYFSQIKSNDDVVSEGEWIDNTDDSCTRLGRQNFYVSSYLNQSEILSNLKNSGTVKYDDLHSSVLELVSERTAEAKARKEIVEGVEDQYAVAGNGVMYLRISSPSLPVMFMVHTASVTEKYSGTVPSHLTPLRAYETKNPLTAKPEWFGISQESRDHAFGAFRAWPGNDRVLYRINPY
jgi:hypothetical protein